MSILGNFKESTTSTSNDLNSNWSGVSVSLSGRRDSDEDIGGDDSIEYDLFAIDNRQENDDDQQIYFCDIDAEISFLSASNGSSTAFSATESIRVSVKVISFMLL